MASGNITTIPQTVVMAAVEKYLPSCAPLLLEDAILGALIPARLVDRTHGVAVIVDAVELPDVNQLLVVEGRNDQALRSLAVVDFRVVDNDLLKASSHCDYLKCYHHSLQVSRQHYMCDVVCVCVRACVCVCTCV